MLAGIIGAEKSALFCFNDCVNAVRIGAGNGDTDFAEDACGKAVSFQMFPRHAIVFGAIKAAARSAAREKPRLPARLPKGREHDVWIVRIEHDIDRAGVFVFPQHLAPCFATVCGSKDSAFLVRTERVPERGYKHHIFISRIDNQRADVPCIFQADVVPGLAGIDRLENPSAVRGIAADRRFAGADVNHIVIGRRNGDRADRGDRLLVEQRNPIRAAIGSFPHAAGYCAKVICVRLARHAFNRQGAPAAKGTNLSPPHPIEQLFVNCFR